MVQSPYWETNWFATSQEIPRISRNPKVHYRTHKRPSTAFILGQPSPVHIPTSRLLEIRPNIIHPSTPRSHQWSLSFRFPQQDHIHTLTSPTRATCPAHLILLDFITRTILGEGYKSLDLQNIEALINSTTSFVPHSLELIIGSYLYYRKAAVRWGSWYLWHIECGNTKICKMHKGTWKSRK